MVEEPGTGPNPEITKPKLAKAEMGAAKSEKGPLRIQGREEVSRTNLSGKGRTIAGSIGAIWSTGKGESDRTAEAEQIWEAEEAKSGA
jgi:hypothetical protein